MLKKDLWLYIIIFISLILWLPALNALVLHIPISYTIAQIMFLLYFISPVLSITITIVALVFMVKKQISRLLGSIIVCVNLAYLVWGIQYLKLIFFIT